MKPNKLALAIACIATSSATVASQENNHTHGSSGAIELEPIIVTATRTEQAADQTLASVTVITRQDIERQQAQSVQDVLRGVPGISIVNNGGMGKTTSVYLRGTGSGHVLVLIDGVKVGSATLGSVAFQDFPIEQIERIEIVRGPRASLYGSEAIGGVIQIFTHKGDGALNPYFSFTGGSYQTYQMTVGVSGGGEKGWVNMSTTTLDTQGFDAKADDEETDKDGYQNFSGSLRGGYRFDNGLELDANLLHAAGDTEYDGSFTNEAESVQQVIGTTLRFSPTDTWLLTLAAGRSQDKSNNLKDGVFSSRINTERNSFSWQNDLSMSRHHLLTLGADYQQDKIDSTNDYTVNSRDNKSVFTQYQGAFGAHDLQLSLRGDDNEQFGKQATGGVAWGYEFRGGLRLTASYGTAFKAPTFNDLYSPYGGNPDLKPEKSRSAELGLSGAAGTGTWSVNLYQTKVDNLIAWQSDSTGIWRPIQVNEAVINGLEAVLSSQLGNWQLNTNLTLLNPENRTKGVDEGNVLPRRAKRSLRFDADRQLGQFGVGATLFAQSQRYDDAANSRELSGYVTVDLRGEYSISKDWRIQAGINNLLDKTYETAANYNQAGRNYSVTLRYQP